MPAVKLKGFLDPADALVPCGLCGAKEGEPCQGVASKSKVARGVQQRGPKQLLLKGRVHFARRVRRLLLTARAPEKRAAFEKEALLELARWLKERAKSGPSSGA